MSRRREPTAEERALFEAALKDAVPIVTPNLRVRPDTAKAKAKPARTHEGRHAPAPKPKAPSGVDGRTAERLHRGEQKPDARIDLHGMTEDAAHRALITFVRSAAMRGCRLLLVITGKGLKPPAADEPFDMELVQRRRGVLKSLTPRWLSEPELAGFVADVRAAHRRHGGEGALYVYLRKQRP